MKTSKIKANGINLSVNETGDGPPMVLLHGWPQTSYAWRKVVPELSRHFRLIIPDLRGMGKSDKPEGGYDMRTVATDIHDLIHALKLEQPYLVGHDWGGLAARRYAIDWPGELKKIAILDIVPHEQLLQNITAEQACGAWHFFFNQVPGLAETLVDGRVEEFLRIFFKPKSADPDTFIPECIEEYTKAYSQPGAFNSFNYYRAMFTTNRELDKEPRDGKIKTPILCLWGNKGGMGGPFDVLKMWRAEAEDVQGEGFDNCGHYIAEEQPEKTTAALLQFFKDG